MTLATAASPTELLSLLGDEVRLYDELLALGRQERETVLGSDPAVLERLVAEKEAVVAQVVRTEAARQQWVAEWARQAGLDEANLTLSSLIERLPPDQAAGLSAQQDALRERLVELSQLNFRNAHLLSSALNVVSRRLEAYQRVTTQIGYRASGETIKASSITQFDRRA